MAGSGFGEVGVAAVWTVGWSGWEAGASGNHLRSPLESWSRDGPTSSRWQESGAGHGQWGQENGLSSPLHFS